MGQLTTKKEVDGELRVYEGLTQEDWKALFGSPVITVELTDKEEALDQARRELNHKHSQF